VDTLRAFLKEELSVKIPFRVEFRQFFFEDYQGRCDEVRGKLFIESDSILSPSSYLVRSILAAKVPQSHHNLTENTLISFWDNLIVLVLTQLVEGSFLRDTNQGTSAMLSRPDLCFYYGDSNICVFRGEEKAGGELDAPLKELCDKLGNNWNYDDAPYLFGYAACGPLVASAMIKKDQNGKAAVEEIDRYNLTTLHGRLNFFLALLHLSTLFSPIVQAIKTKFGRPEYGIVEQPNGVSIHLGLQSVIKYYPSSMPFKSILTHLKLVHGKMKKSSVPHVVQLTSASIKRKRACLSPRGYSIKPSDRNELVKALLDIIEALISMHELKIFHRDLRWDNVLRYDAVDGQNWFIIDFDDSAFFEEEQSNGNIQQARDVQRADPSTHAPELYFATQNEKVDIWSVGYLIRTTGFSLCQEEELIGIMTDCMQENPEDRPTAVNLKVRLTPLLKK
jgi:serine/threonine protein kinase